MAVLVDERQAGAEDLGGGDGGRDGTGRHTYFRSLSDLDVVQSTAPNVRHFERSPEQRPPPSPSPSPSPPPSPPARYFSRSIWRFFHFGFSFRGGAFFQEPRRVVPDLETLSSSLGKASAQSSRHHHFGQHQGNEDHGGDAPVRSIVGLGLDGRRRRLSGGGGGGDGVDGGDGRGSVSGEDEVNDGLGGGSGSEGGEEDGEVNPVQEGGEEEGRGKGGRETVAGGEGGWEAREGGGGDGEMEEAEGGVQVELVAVLDPLSAAAQRASTFLALVSEPASGCSVVLCFGFVSFACSWACPFLSFIVRARHWS